MRQFLHSVAAVMAVTGASAAHAHVPYIEGEDLAATSPFLIEDVAQSKAIYAWLESPDDIDHYMLKVETPARIYIKVLVPFCAQLAEFRPTFALIGPGLPQAKEPLPVTIPAGYGSLLARERIAAQRPRMFEFFSDQYYYEGPVLEIHVKEAGLYRLIYWHEQGHTGDYVAIIGYTEDFSLDDMPRAATTTLDIRRKRFLHGECNQTTRTGNSE